MEQFFAEQLELRQQQGLLRQRLPLESGQSIKVNVANQALLNFASSDYLGLANHPKMKAAFVEGVERFGVGSGASAMVCGYSYAHQALEEKLATLLNVEKTLFFSSGYAANLGTVTALANCIDVILQDHSNHASLIDAAQLTKVPMRRYLHNDVASLKKHLQKQQNKKALVISERVFSMEGDLAPLDELNQTLSQGTHLFMVDDAHGFGILGLGAQRLSSVYMATFSKALGSVGAFIAGKRNIIDYIMQHARSYTYTTALPPAVAWANCTALDLMSEYQPKLQDNIAYYSERVKALGINCVPTQSAIQAIVIGDEKKACNIQATLKQQGIWVGLMRYPSVAKSKSLLRVGLSAAHSNQHIDQLLNQLEVCLCST